MKKICVLLLVQLLVIGTASYGAVSDDVYVRKDVFDAKMEALFNQLHGEIENFGTRLEGKIDALSERIDRNFDILSARIDGLDKRMDNQQNYLYLVLVIMGIIVTLPTVQKMLQGWQDRKDSRRAYITLEDVRRLIEENNAKLQGKPQV